MRVDQDSLGAVSIPDDALYSSNTVRGAGNFRLIPSSGMPDSRWGFPSGPISDTNGINF